MRRMRDQFRTEQGLSEAGNEVNHQQYQDSLYVPAAAATPTLRSDTEAALKGTSDVFKAHCRNVPRHSISIRYSCPAPNMAWITELLL